MLTMLVNNQIRTYRLLIFIEIVHRVYTFKREGTTCDEQVLVLDGVTLKLWRGVSKATLLTGVVTDSACRPSASS